MSCSGSDHDEEGTLEAMPLELLHVHQGLEQDGCCWRATLPLPDKLLRRVVVSSTRGMHAAHRAGLDIQMDGSSSLLHHRPRRHDHH